MLVSNGNDLTPANAAVIGISNDDVVYDELIGKALVSAVTISSGVSYIVLIAHANTVKEIPLVDVTNQVTWTNDAAGAAIAVADISAWLVDVVTPDVGIVSMPVNSTESGILTAAGQTVAITIPPGGSAVGVQISGTWSGQIDFEGSIDDVNYTSIYASDTTVTNATQTNGIFLVPSGGILKVRARASSWTSGSADVTLIASVGSVGSLLVGVSSISTGDNVIGQVKLTDGTDVADVLDLTNSNPLTVAVVDGSGDQVTAFGGGTQYTEGATDATITGTATLWEDAGDTLVPVSAVTPLPVNVVAGSTSGTEYTQGDVDASITGVAVLMEGAADTLLPIQGTVADGLLVNLGANNDVTGTVTANAGTDLNTSALALEATLQSVKTAVEILDNVVAGSEAQVDVVTLPAITGTVTANAGTNLDTSALVLETTAQAIKTAVEILDNTVAGSEMQVDVVTLPGVGGDVAHDAVNSGSPLLNGFEAIAHGTNPTAVAAGDRTKAYANRAGVPFTIGGHPAAKNAHLLAVGAQTDTAIITIAGGLKIVVTQLTVTLDSATTATGGVQFRIGFGTANTPANNSASVLLQHSGLAAGSGVVVGNGGGILGVGADGEDLRITCEDPTGGNLDVCVTYFTIES